MNGMLPPDRTVKNKTVMSGGNNMPYKGKSSPEDKLRIVEEYTTGKIGLTAASQECGVDPATILKWVCRYKAEGASCFLPTKSHRTYTRETKQSAVMDYLTGKGSLLEISKVYRIRSASTLSNWIKVYNSHEEFQIHTGGSRMTKGRETTPAERIEIARKCISQNNNYGEIALEYQVSYQQVYTWVKKYRVMGEAGLEDRRGKRVGTLPSRTPEEELRDRIAQLEREKLDLEMENALLKKVKELERRRR